MQPQADAPVQSEQPAAATPAPAPKPRVVVRPAVEAADAAGQAMSQPCCSNCCLPKSRCSAVRITSRRNRISSLTRETKDPRIAQRATEVAWNSRFLGAALETAGIWLAADPESMQARQMLAALLVNQSRLADAEPHLQTSLAADKENIGNNFLQLNTLLARHPDKAAVLQLTQNLAQPYPALPEAHYSIAQAAMQRVSPRSRSTKFAQALNLRADWEQAALFQGQLLQRTSNAEALAYFQRYLKEYPRAHGCATELCAHSGDGQKICGGARRISGAAQRVSRQRRSDDGGWFALAAVQRLRRCRDAVEACA